MVRPRQVGPDLPSGLRFPDRSVSLPSPELQRMGLGVGGAPGKFGGGYGVHTRISESDGEYRVRLFIDGEYQAGADYFTDDVAEAHETAKAMEEDAHLSDKDSDVARDEARDFVEDAIMRPDLGEVEVPEDLVADDARLPVKEMRGLTADEAFQQHHAMSRRADPNQGELPGTGGPREQIEGAKEQVQPRTPEEQAAWEKALRERGHGVPAPVVPPPQPPPVSQMAGREPWPGQQKVPLDVVGEPGLVPPPREPWPGQQKVPLDVMNPEARSMDSQMLIDTVAAQAGQGSPNRISIIEYLVERLPDLTAEQQSMIISLALLGGSTLAGGGGLGSGGISGIDRMGSGGGGLGGIGRFRGGGMMGGLSMGGGGYATR